jgi:hypothetical protein
VIVFGLRHYGAVDQLGDGPYVATRFFHLMFVPIVPAAGSSVLVVDSDHRGVRGLTVPLSFKSILAAYWRAATLCYAIAAFFWSFGNALFLFRTLRPWPAVLLGGSVCSGLTAAMLFVLSYWLFRPGASRREHLHDLLRPGR